MIQPADAELEDLFLRHQAVAVRYSVPSEASQGCLSYHVCYEGPTYDLANLSGWARKNVRRGLRNCTIEPISFDRLIEDGWVLCVDSVDRQRRSSYLTADVWRQRCNAAADLPGFEAWGALVEGRLSAFLLTLQMEDCSYMVHQQCHRDCLRDHVSNALTFGVTRTIVARPQVRSVFYGMHSLDAPPSVDEFKLRMGYIAKRVRQRIVFSPLLAPFINPLSHAVVKQILRLQRQAGRLSKAEGMIRFYLAGKQHLEAEAA